MSTHDAIMSRHSKDLVVGECKDGPTWFGGHLRLDYWVLRRSWAHPAMIGYEVKSGRRDFLSDNKWPGYLPLCNELWFVSETKDAIRPDELPAEVGLLRLAGSRLITVKRAVWREIEPPVTLMTYILMCRTKIKNEVQDDRSQAEFWRSWLAEKAEKQAIGYQCGKRLRELYEQNVERVQSENKDLKSKIEHAERLSAALAAKGIDWSTWVSAEVVEAELKAPRWEADLVERAYEALRQLLKKAAE